MAPINIDNVKSSRFKEERLFFDFLYVKHAQKLSKCIYEVSDCLWYTSELNKLKLDRRISEFK